MATLSGADLVKQLEWRYAVKKFDSKKKIIESDWQALQKALLLTASSIGLQPWKFLVVQDMSVRKKLTPASWNQSQVEDCSHFIVFTSLHKLDEAYVDRYLQRICEVRGVTPESLAGLKKMAMGNVNGVFKEELREWAARQAYTALGNLMTSAAVMGIDACPMEGFEPLKYDEILGLKNSDYSTSVACALGYRSATDTFANFKKVRFDPSDIFKLI